MLVVVDQAGQEIAAGQVDQPRALKPASRQGAVGHHGRDSPALDHHGHIPPERRAGAVDQRGVAVDGPLRRLTRGGDEERGEEQGEGAHTRTLPRAAAGARKKTLPLAPPGLQKLAPAA